MPQIAPLQPGDPTNLGPFVLSGRLGEGGQGVVYFGQDEAGERAAVKLLHVKFSGDATARSRFARELRAAQRVASFCTARVLAADLEGDTPYIASEFIDGRSLRETVEEDGPLTGSSLERLAVGTATALTAIHQAGIVHRDFKPDNVLLAVDGPRVVDFGIARILDSTATITSRAIGTPAYMAPEQISGGTVGPPADVFSWASTIAFAATGDVVFGGNSIAVVLNRILNHDIDTGMLPEPLGGVVRACLRKSPDERPAADQILLRLLGRAVSGDASAVVLSEGAAHAADPDALARTGPVRAPATGGAGRLPTGGARTGTGAGAGSGPAVGSGPGAGSGVWTGTGDHAGHAGNAGQAGHAANAGRARNAGHAGSVSQGGHGGNAGQAGHAGNVGQGGHAANARQVGQTGHTGNISQGGHAANAGQAGNDASTGASQSASLSGPTNPRFGAVPREGTGASVVTPPYGLLWRLSTRRGPYRPGPCQAERDLLAPGRLRDGAGRCRGIRRAGRDRDVRDGAGRDRTGWHRARRHGAQRHRAQRHRAGWWGTTSPEGPLRRARGRARRRGRRDRDLGRQDRLRVR